MVRMIGTATVLGILLVVCGVTNAAETTKKEKLAKRGLKAYKPNKFLDIKGDKNARVEDLIVKPMDPTAMFASDYSQARVSIKNLTKNRVHVTVYLALYDKDGQLILCGNYSSSIVGFKARESSTENIDLGRSSRIKEAKYYKAWIVTQVKQK